MVKYVFSPGEDVQCEGSISKTKKQRLPTNVYLWSWMDRSIHSDDFQMLLPGEDQPVRATLKRHATNTSWREL